MKCRAGVEYGNTTYPEEAHMRTWICLALLLALTGLAFAQAKVFRPRTLLGGEYWGTQPEPGYLDYLAAVKPDLIHGAVVGPELLGSVYGKGALKGITPVYPPQVSTVKAYLAFWRGFNADAHKLGVKVQATTSMNLVWGDRAKNTGFFKYYHDLWETDLFGAKPAPTPEALLQVDVNGEVLSEPYGEWRQYHGCPNNPRWRQLLKQLAKPCIAAGFDGFMVQFPYYDGRCCCASCRQKFHDFIAARYGQAEADALPAFTGAANAPAKYALAAREFSAISVKDCFDEVFVQYGRGVKPALILSMWTHFRNFLGEDATNATFDGYLDERTLLPIARWGAGENYLWYSSPTYVGDLKNGRAGDSALDGRVLRAMANGTPFEILKYDYFRWRLVTGESWALGGICFGAWKGGWSGGQDRETPHHLQSYYRFGRTYDKYLNPALRQSYGEIGMIYPRQALFAGDASFFGPFRAIGRALVQGQVLFDAIIDQRMTPEMLARHAAVIVVAPQYLHAAQRAMLQAYLKAGGKVIVHDARLMDGAATLEGDLADRRTVAEFIRQHSGIPVSRFTAPWTTEVYADTQAGHKRLLLHFVNFRRDESQANKEVPIMSDPVAVDLRLPMRGKVASVSFITPEAAGVQPMVFQQKGDRVSFSTPKFLVYGLAVVQMK